MAEALHTICEQVPACHAERCVRDIMTTPVHTVDMDDSILHVKRLFEREGCHHAIITKHRQAHGVVSDRDLLKVLSPFVGSKTMERSQDLNTLKKRVHQIMSRDLVTIKPDEAIAATAEKMLQERVSCLPVLDDNGTILGIVTVRDFLKWSVDQAGVNERHADELAQDEGVLVVIDGNHCYAPDAKIARRIRKAARQYDAKNGVDSAQAKRLPMIAETTDPKLANA